MRYVIACTALWLLASGCFSSSDPYTMREQEEQPGAGYEFEGNTVRYSSPEVMLEITYLNSASLDVYFSKFRGGKYKNPVPPGPYRVFSLSIHNRTGDRAVSFNPGLAMFHSKTVKPNPVKDYTSFYTDLELLQFSDVEARMESYKAACFDRMVTVAPGESVQSLLVFQKPDDMGDGGRIVVDGLYVGSKSRSVFFTFGQGLEAP